MMAADLNLQVWLETVPDTHPSLVIPYIRSPEDGAVQYQLAATRSGRSGTSSISQGGVVHANANQPTALSQFSLSGVESADRCTIEITLTTRQEPAKTYRFACPRPGS
ncbi:Curli assembly protein CsgC OS=Castellaniella defragrans OX=75697 GN=HNR28_002560 PE=3 SV=1 [Castellaniella defragrans]